MNISKLAYCANSEDLFSQLSQLPHCVWLDSGRPGDQRERYDILTAMPSSIIDKASAKDLCARLQSKLDSHTNSSDLPFSGGWIGCLNYDFRHSHFGLASRPSTQAAWFGWYDWAIVVDHQLEQTSLLVLKTCPAATLAELERALRAVVPPATFVCSEFRADEQKKTYIGSIKRIKDYLLAGDCYQVNYTQRFTADFAGNAASAYVCLRNAVPSPFSAYLDLGGSKILSISPERFVQLQAQRALAQPIKGTIGRGTNKEEDEKLSRQLQRSDKNRAENVMIVDLLRNDFGQHCLPGSVEVPQLFEVQSFANVHHLVSSVCGTLPTHVSHPEFVLACFPGGSITGAPKKRAMEIIQELESHNRQAYCGSIGYFSCNNKSDFNIAIRTLVQSDKKIRAWAGGGIVMDSEADAEYDECLTKIGRLLRALEHGSASD